MTYEEALSHADKELEAYEHKVADGKAFYAKYAEFWKIVVKAIWKQIPKKPILWRNPPCPPDYADDDWGYKCPHCGRDIDDTEHHCVCGQAIDWEEDEV